MFCIGVNNYLRKLVFFLSMIPEMGMGSQEHGKENKPLTPVFVSQGHQADNTVCICWFNCFVLNLVKS